MPIHVATGGNPQSTIDIAKLGLPIVYAIIGGNPNYLRKLVNLYVNTAKKMVMAGNNLKYLHIRGGGFLKRSLRQKKNIFSQQN